MKWITIKAWITAYSKRLWKRPLFCLALLLIPLVIFGIKFLIPEDQGTINIGLYAKTPYTKEVCRSLEKENDKTIQYHLYDEETDLLDDVSRQNCVAGYCLEDDTIWVHSAKDSPYIYVVNELIYAAMYPKFAQKIAEDYLRRRTGQNLWSYVEDQFQDYDRNIVLVEFEYSDGTKNTLLQHNPVHAVLFPVRGIYGILICFLGMMGLIYYREDHEKKRFTWCSPKEKQSLFYIYLGLPMLLAYLSGIFVLTFCGISSGFCNEIVLGACYMLFLMGYLRLLHTLIPVNLYLYGTFPIILLGSLFLCPVFFNMKILFPGIKIMEKIFPVCHYLEAVYSVREKIIMCLLGILFLLLAALIRRIKQRNQPSFRYI